MYHHEEVRVHLVVQVRVMDPFTVKPLDWEAVRAHAAVCGGRVVTVEDHYPEVGH